MLAPRIRSEIGLYSYKDQRKFTVKEASNLI
jgi:hypothetical protein